MLTGRHAPTALQRQQERSRRYAEARLFAADEAARRATARATKKEVARRAAGGPPPPGIRIALPGGSSFSPRTLPWPPNEAREAEVQQRLEEHREAALKRLETTPPDQLSPRERQELRLVLTYAEQVRTGLRKECAWVVEARKRKNVPALKP
jgi:hypothetical protein